MTPWTTLILGFALGVRHALDADHVVAISTILSQNRNPFRAALVGAFWGIGHTLTLLLVGLAVILFELRIPDRLALSMEFLVGIVLFVLGLQIFWKYRKKGVHTHLHDHTAEALTHEHFHVHIKDKGHRHGPLAQQYRSLLVGMIHGLAGSGALMLLVLGTIRTPVEGVAYILVFGCGSILAMVLISTAIGLPVAISARRFMSFNHAIRLVAGAVSMMLGIVIMVEIGFLQGLFR